MNNDRLDAPGEQDAGDTRPWWERGRLDDELSLLRVAGIRPIGHDPSVPWVKPPEALHYVDFAELLRLSESLDTAQLTTAIDFLERARRVKETTGAGAASLDPNDQRIRDTFIRVAAAVYVALTADHKGRRRPRQEEVAGRMGFKTTKTFVRHRSQYGYPTWHALVREIAHVQ
jgi:hypothetical protein